MYYYDITFYFNLADKTGFYLLLRISSNIDSSSNVYIIDYCCLRFSRYKMKYYPLSNLSCLSRFGILVKIGENWIHSLIHYFLRLLIQINWPTRSFFQITSYFHQFNQLFRALLIFLLYKNFYWNYMLITIMEIWC